MHVLVTGPTGFVGRRLVPALRAAGRYDAPSGVDVGGDLLDPDSFVDALDVDAASAAGVDRVLYLGGLGEDRDHSSAYLRSRREADRVLAAGTYDLTTLRAAIVVGPRSAGFEVVAQLASRLPVMVTPRWVRTPCQPIAVADAIAFLVGVLDVPETAGKTYEIGGPEVLTYAEMLRRTGRRLGHDPIVLAVPVLTSRPSAYWVGPMTDVPRSVARPPIEGRKNPVVVHDDRLPRLAAVDPTPSDGAVRHAIPERSTEVPG